MREKTLRQRAAIRVLAVLFIPIEMAIIALGWVLFVDPERWWFPIAGVLVIALGASGVHTSVTDIENNSESDR